MQVSRNSFESFLIFLLAKFRALHDGNPAAWPNGRTYIFSDSTSTSSLRPHLEKYHSELYLSLAQERGWKIQLPGIVSQARSNVGENANSQDSPPDDFSEETFHNYLLRFIVADDQVPIFTHRALRFAHWHLSRNFLFCPLISSPSTSLNARNSGFCYCFLGTASRNL